MEEPKQLWIVVDDENNWLWHGRGSQKDAVAGAKAVTKFRGIDISDTNLYLYAVSAQIIISPEATAK